jgi:cardiolipin synthase
VRSTPTDSPSLGAPGTTPWRHLPNVLTVLRMLLVVPLAWLIDDRRFDAALIVAAVAGATDAIDGFLAKRCGWQSWLGGVLDPLADKLMLLACFLSLGLIGAHPLWLAWLVIGRDVVIVAGAATYHFLIGRLSAEPTPLSKLTTLIQICYVLAQLLHLTTWFQLPATSQALMWAVVALTIASGLQYVAVWSAKARGARRGGPRAENRE